MVSSIHSKTSIPSHSSFRQTLLHNSSRSLHSSAAAATMKSKDGWDNGIGKPSIPIAPSKDSKPFLCFSIPRLLLFFFFFFCILLLYLFYPANIFLSTTSCPTSTSDDSSSIHLSSTYSSNQTTTRLYPPPPATSQETATSLQHIVFSIAASAKLWERRREYIKLWWRPRQMRGFVWLDRRVKDFNSSSTRALLPSLRISGDTSRFPYTHRLGDRSAIRISRIVSETYRLGLPGVRWYVMGDDDTVFVPDNLARVLSRFDHRQPYYIGSPSESHLQNIFFSYAMAYGGGGFAISAPLAASLSRMQDRCLRRYPALYGSDDRIQACMTELGVPLTRHPGFHQYDVYGDLLGLLAAHPVAPLISLHHLDVVQPIFPRAASRAAALRRLFDGPASLDPAGLMQQSICYEANRLWTVSVAWGFAVLVARGVNSPREMEMPVRTFLNWYRRADYTAYAFNTRPVARHPCQRPFVYYLSASRYDRTRRTTVTVYDRHRDKRQACRWRIPDPSSLVDRVVVYKKPDPGLWDRSPRRNCCRVRGSLAGDRTMVIVVGVCREGEVTEILDSQAAR